MKLSSSILFATVLTFALSFVAWWTYFQVRESQRLEIAANNLVIGNIDATATALGATDARDLQQLARSRRRMFLSEGVVFSVLLAVGGALFVAAMRRESATRREHDRFLTGATHELKTPLATIRLGLESMRDGRVPEAKRDAYVCTMLRESDRLQSGLTNLLTAAGLRATGRHLSLSDGNLADDVRNAMVTLAPLADAAGVTLKATHIDDAPTTRDSEAVRLILHNLLDNAVKYSGRGAGVQVSLQNQGADARLCVADTGAGIQRQELTRVFKPFYRSEDPAVTAGGGVGLGLHLVQELVTSHGGTVVATSAGLGRGSEFTVTIPLRSPKS